jgi:hypothetical protein
MDHHGSLRNIVASCDFGDLGCGLGELLELEESG